MINLEAYTENFKLKYELFINGCDSIEEIELWDKEELGEMEAFYTNDLMSSILRLIAVDGNISQKEVEYINKAFGFQYALEELVEVYEKCIDNIKESIDKNFANGFSHMKKINEKLADAYKEMLSAVCDIIIGSDGVISPAEIEEAKRLKDLCE